jgi:hypothetical protein
MIHWGDGTGKLTGALKEDCTSATPRTFGNRTSMAVGDFNGDNNLDVISLGNGSGSGQMFGDGKGGFSRSSEPMPHFLPFPEDVYPAGFVTAGDVNADGILDAVVAFGAGIQVLLGESHPLMRGSFTSKPAIAMPGQAYSTTLADWNGDGLMDIAVAGPNGVSVLLGDGKGEFAPSAFFHVPMNVNLPIQMAAADVNGDGRLDLIVPANGGTVLLGAPASTVAQLSTSSSATIASGQPVPLTLTLRATDSAFQSPSGAVTFYDGTRALETMTQTTSAYSFNALNLAPGVHQISAKYDGNARSVGSASNTITIEVTPAGTSISSGTGAASPFSSPGLAQKETLVSPNGKYAATMQSDGNFVIYGEGVAIWSTQTQNKGLPPYRLAMQPDGKLVIYGSSAQDVSLGGFGVCRANSACVAIWSRSTPAGNAPYSLTMRDDGNLVVYDGKSAPVWQTGTQR